MVVLRDPATPICDRNEILSLEYVDGGRLASYPGTPPEVLVQLADLTAPIYGLLIEAVAGNPSTPAETLRALADYCSEEVAGNPSTPPDVLATLKDKHPDRVADNPSTDLQTLTELTRHEFDDIAYLAERELERRSAASSGA